MVPGVPGGAAMLRGGDGRWDRGRQRLGPSPWLAARRFPGAGSFPRAPAPRFLGRRSAVFSPPRGPRRSRAPLLKGRSGVGWMLGSSPTPRGSFSPPWGRWTPSRHHRAGPAGVVRSADTAQRLSALRGKTGVRGAGRPRGPAGGGMPSRGR